MTLYTLAVFADRSLAAEEIIVLILDINFTMALGVIR